MEMGNTREMILKKMILKTKMRRRRRRKYKASKIFSDVRHVTLSISTIYKNIQVDFTQKFVDVAVDSNHEKSIQDFLNGSLYDDGNIKKLAPDKYYESSNLK